MFSSLLVLHSMFRWIVLVSLLFAIFRGFYGWNKNRPFTKLDNTTRHWTATITHIQLMIGVWLYFISPWVAYVFRNYSDAVSNREARFFGVEHAPMMLLAITIISIGSAKAKRKATDQQKFKTMALWYTVGLIIILINIPWSFSPFVSRPEFRMF